MEIDTNAEKNSKGIFLKCDCHTEGLHIEPDFEDDLFYFAYWNTGFGKSKGFSFKERIQYCWRVLTKGKPYEDMVILNKETIKELVEYLNSFLKKENNETKDSIKSKKNPKDKSL